VREGEKKRIEYSKLVVCHSKCSKESNSKPNSSLRSE